MRFAATILLGLAAGALATGGAFASDAGAGEKVFKSKCGSCHTVEEGKNRTGPSLHGIIGRKAAQVAGFKYSDDMKGSGIVWSNDKLAAYLEDPKKVVPKGSMVFAGLKKQDERDNVIAFLAGKK